MYPYLDQALSNQEILARIPPKLQAILSKTQNELAKERKYKSLLYPITVEELEKAGVDEFYVAVGNRENHVFTKWSLDDQQPLASLYADYSMLVEDGEIIKQNRIFASTSIAVDDIEDALEWAEYFTQSAYQNNQINDSSLDYVGLTMDTPEIEEDEVNVYYPIANVYHIAALRCKEAALDKDVYALRFVMDYYQEMSKLLLKEELDFDLEYEISNEIARAEYEEGDW